METSSVVVSAIICTRNRAQYLRDALGSLLAQDYSVDNYEIIVVDNGSTDGTRAVVEANSAPRVPVRYVYEGQPGLSRARNAGAAASEAEILAFMDDDALPDPSWLSAITEAFAHLGSHVGAIGGKVEVVWEGSPPDWLSDAFLPYFSGTDRLGEIARLLNDHEYPVGANFSLRRAALQAIGGFDVALTRYNDELDVCGRLRQQGWQIWYLPEARVKHRIPGQRVTRRSLLRRAYWQGYSDVTMEHGPSLPSPASLLWSSAVLLSQSGRDGVKALAALLQSRPDQAMSLLFDATGRLGRARAQLGLAFAGSR